MAYFKTGGVERAESSRLKVRNKVSGFRSDDTMAKRSREFNSIAFIQSNVRVFVCVCTAPSGPSCQQ